MPSLSSYDCSGPFMSVCLTMVFNLNFVGDVNEDSELDEDDADIVAGMT